MENPIKMDDLGVPLFWETSIGCRFVAVFFLRISPNPKQPSVRSRIDGWNRLKLLCVKSNIVSGSDILSYMNPVICGRFTKDHWGDFDFFFIKKRSWKELNLLKKTSPSFVKLGVRCLWNSRRVAHKIANNCHKNSAVHQAGLVSSTIHCCEAHLRKKVLQALKHQKTSMQD